MILSALKLTLLIYLDVHIDRHIDQYILTKIVIRILIIILIKIFIYLYIDQNSDQYIDRILINILINVMRNLYLCMLYLNFSFFPIPLPSLQLSSYTKAFFHFSLLFSSFISFPFLVSIFPLSSSFFQVDILFLFHNIYYTFWSLVILLVPHARKQGGIYTVFLISFS